MSYVQNKYPMVTLVTYIIGLHDPYGVHHSERVAALSLRIGERLLLHDEALEILELAGLLHDLGKLAIPEATRGKPGELTEAETMMMRQHPELGLKILAKMNGAISRRVHMAILHHHENYGGGGYPLGLQGKDIPLESRIIRIVDTYDALTHARGYRLPLERENALRVMETDQEKEHLFDPDLFRLFLSSMEAR